METKKRLIVVLGMHRSGTSAVTRGLQVMGVILGERMMPPVEGNNAKGFWEDIDLNALNIELLDSAGSDWHYLSSIEQHDVESLRSKGYVLRAVELLRQKTSSVRVFGFKDPRVAKLLPFWIEVFNHCQLDTGYVLAIRHPLSVVKSLAKRDFFDTEKSYFLWLEHVIGSLIGCINKKPVLIDYDLLMASPDCELRRIADRFDLCIDLNELELYKTEFLDHGLRHTAYTLNDLLLDEACPPLVFDVYTTLLGVASGNAQIDSPEIQERIQAWVTEHNRLSAAFRLVDKLYARCNDSAQAIALSDGQIANLNHAVAECDGQIANLNHAVIERDGQIANLNHAVAERDGQIANLNHAVVERDGQIVNLNHAAVERDGQISYLNQEVAGRYHEIFALRNSTSWKITQPLRRLSSLVSGNWKEIRLSENKALRKLFRIAKRNYLELTQNLEKLPKDFDAETYLKLNSDMADSGMDPATHYLIHGHREGRKYLLPALDMRGGHNLKADRETILVVSHEASRTGAPILSLNIVQSLSGRYNVVALLLGGGPLSKEFQKTGAGVITATYLKGNPVMTELLVGQLCTRFNFKFALVNSIESREILPALCNCFVPTISLIHEFASYTRPRYAFRYTLFWSGEAVFSTRITLENALEEYPDLSDHSAHVLPQGRCLLPAEVSAEEQIIESARIRRLIRPKGTDENTLVVLGAGFVQLRKGVDLFIDCAARVVRTPGGRKCRFVWVGKGYDPDNDVGYSVYLADQIRRAGLQGHVFFIDETTAIETAYEEADLLLLSSRLDPLPNVAIDAMAQRVPVLCFDKTTGIADFLNDNGLGKYCVAGYLDAEEMAEKILVLANSQAIRADVAERCQIASVASFNMEKYVARLEVFAQEVEGQVRQEKADTQMILNSGLFRKDYSAPPHGQNESHEKLVRAYVRGWASGVDRRKPFPGFHPGIYLEQHGVAVCGADPFADYLRAGKPDGIWCNPVIVAGEVSDKALPSSRRIALHIHAYYPELLSEMVSRLSHNQTCPDLFVSITNEQGRDLVKSQLREYKGKIVDIQLVPNRGRDIGPFLTEFGSRILADYDYVGHIHTKKSVDVKDAAVGQRWYRFLLENLLGGESGAMTDSILAKMESDASIGMVFPDDPNVVGWSANRNFAEPFVGRMGIEKLPEHFIFPVGTMFWARVSALAPLINLNLDWGDYPEEPLPYDGSSLHAIERLAPLVLSSMNLRSATTNVIGLTR